MGNFTILIPLLVVCAIQNTAAAPAMVNSMSQMLRCHGVVPEDRKDCGFSLVSSEECLVRGCCWRREADYQVSVPWCYLHPAMSLSGCEDTPCAGRVSCGETVSTWMDCVSQDCCWVPSSEPGAPWCFKKTGTSTTSPSTTTTSKPPTEANFILSCRRPWPELNFTLPYDICWLDENTILEVDGFRMVKYKVDFNANTCESEVFKTDFNNDMTCRQHGKVYITSQALFDNIKVRIYDVATAEEEIWRPTEYDGYTYVTVSVRDDLIILSAGNGSYVYNKNRQFLYRIEHEFVTKPYTDSLLTQGGFYWGTSGNKTEVVNLKTNETILVNEGVDTADCITGTEGYVYISGDFEQQIAVYLEDGTFLDFLKIDNLGEGYLSKINVITKQDGEVFLVMAPLGDGTPPLMVYSITP